MTDLFADLSMLQTANESLQRFLGSLEEYFKRVGQILEIFCRQIGPDERSQVYSREYLLVRQAFSEFSREARDFQEFIQTKGILPAEKGIILAIDLLPLSPESSPSMILARLLEVSTAITLETNQITDAFSQLGKSWKDTHFFKFNQVFLATLRAIGRFTAKSQDFINHLDKLAEEQAA